jgi:hypothetical protein
MKIHPACPVLLLACVLLAGCETTNLRNTFTGYTRQGRSFQNALSSGDSARLSETIADIDHDCQSSDRILYLQERGRMRSMNGDAVGSTADYQVASDFFESKRMEGTLTVANGLFNAAAIATNDLAMPYEGHGFEKVMLHNEQAMNYLVANNYDFARIELNHADVEQAYSLEKHAKIVAEADKKSQEQQLSLDAANASLAEKTSQAAFGAGAVKNSFQNAFTFYLRGTLYEESRDYDRALIEYKKALEIYSENRFVAEAAMRTALLCGATRDRETLTNIYGKALKGTPVPQGSGRVVVVYEQGFVLARSTFRLPFIWNGQILELVLPYYDTSAWRPADGLDVSVAGAAAHTQTLCNLDAMAVRALQEEYTEILVRQILRMIAKYKIQQKSEEQNPLLGFATKVASVVTDRADDRNWLTLPQSVQVAECFLPEGRQELSLTAPGVAKSVALNVIPGKTVYVFASQFGPNMVVRSADFAPAPVPAQ